MKTILVPFHSPDVCMTGLHVAAMLARRFGSYVEGLLVGEGVQLELGEGMSVAAETLSDFVRQWRTFAGESRDSFRLKARENGLTMGELGTVGAGPIAGWRELEGNEAQVVGEYGRLFDLILLGRPLAWTTRWQATCEAALFESGRPVLLASTGPVASIGHAVAIAWNGSTETARTLALAMPLLATAAKVVVVSVEGAMVGGPPGRDVAAHLLRNGIDARATTIEPGARSIGETFLAAAADAGVDLLIKGAYTRSRLRQYIFGGATEHILKHATLPVLMAH
jgi:Universal stress protein UspA and related nucleotide-binding proteins